MDDNNVIALVELDGEDTKVFIDQYGTASINGIKIECDALQVLAFQALRRRAETFMIRGTM